MRIANVANRAHLVLRAADGSDRLIDIADASDQQFGPTPAALYADWAAFSAWAAAASLDPEQGAPVDRTALAAPSPEPRQVFAIGLTMTSTPRSPGSRRLRTCHRSSPNMSRPSRDRTPRS